MTASPPTYDFSVTDAPAFDMLAAAKIAKLAPSRRRDKVLTQLKRAAKRVAPDAGAGAPDDVAAWTEDDVEDVVDALADAWDDASKRSFLTLLRDSLIEQEKQDITNATSALASPIPAAAAAAVSSPAPTPAPASPTKPEPPSTSGASLEAAAAPPSPERPATLSRKPGMGIALPGMAGMFKPKPVEAEVAVSEPEPAPAPTAPPKPLEDVRKNRVKPPRPPRGKAVHLVEDEEESAPTETAPSPPAESLAESEIPPPIPPLPPIDFGSPIDLGISGLGDAGQEHVSEPEPVASVESIHWDESLADVTTVATTPSQLPESHSETTPLPPVAAPVSAPAAVPAPAVPPPALPPVPPRRSVPRTPATEEPHHDIEAATPEAEHPPVPRPPPALSLDHAPPVPVSPTAMHHAPPETPPRSSSEGKALPTVPAPSPAAQASHGPVPVTGLPAAAVPSISAPAVPPPHTPSLPPAPTPSTSSPLPMPAAAPMSMVTSVEHAQQEEKKGGMFSKMKSMFRKGGKGKEPSPTASTAPPVVAARAVEPAPRVSVASRPSIESGDSGSKRTSIASVEMPAAPPRPASQVVPESPIAEEHPAVEPVPMAQPSPPQRPSLPARPMSVGSDLAASVNLPPVAGSPSLELQGSRPSIEAAMTPVEEESHAAEEGEEVKPKKYLPNAAMSALAAAMKSGAGAPSVLQKRRSTGAGLRAAAPLDSTPPPPSETSSHPTPTSEGSPAIPEPAELPESSSSTRSVPPIIAEIQSPISTNEPSPPQMEHNAEDAATPLADAGLATAATTDSVTEVVSQSTEMEMPKGIPEPAESAQEEVQVKTPKLIYGARPHQMVAGITGELKKRAAATHVDATGEEHHPEEHPSEDIVGAEGAVTEPVAGQAAELSAEKPAIPVRPRLPPKIPPKAATSTLQPSSSPSAEVTADISSTSTENEPRATLQRRTTGTAVAGPEMHWDGAPVPLVITKKSAIDTSNDAVVEENMIQWLQKHVDDKEFGKENLYPSLVDGIVLIKALEKASGASAGRYNKRAIMPAQQMDNLQVLVNFMSKLGIEANNVRPLDFFNQEKQKVLVAFVAILRKFADV